MAKKSGKKFQRGGVNKAANARVSRLKEDGVVDINKAEASVEELLDLPMEVEEVRFLQRELAKSGIGDEGVDSRLTEERDAREEYNTQVLNLENIDPLYTQLRLPKGGILIKLFKKPIFEVNGFLKPDLVKRPRVDSSGQERGFYYEENKFPYLDAGVVVAASGEAGGRFDLSIEELEGAIVATKLGTRIDQRVCFIDRSEVSPTYFEGHIILGASDLEFVLATKDDPHREGMYNKLIGKVSASALNERLEEEAKERETKAEENHKTEAEKILIAEEALKQLEEELNNDK